MTRSESSLRRIALTVWSVEVAMLVLNVAVTLAAPAEYRQGNGGFGQIAGDALFTLMGYSLPTIGLLVVWRQPRNRFAWFLLLVIGPAIAVSTLLDAYIFEGLVTSPGSLPGAEAVAGLAQGSWVWVIGSVGILLLLLFPDGHPPSPRWRWLAWVGAVDIIVVWLSVALLPGVINDGVAKGHVNPLGLEGLETQVMAVFIVSLALLPMCMVAAAVAMVRRFRRSHGTERLQLKWFAAATSFVAVSYLVAMLGQFFKDEPFNGPDPWWLLVLQNVAAVSFIALPVAIGVAILRHRLYDIDVLIRRTVIYGLLTVTLAAVYFLLVLTLRSWAGSIAGDSDLAVATSTLAVAALFRPLRRRIQQVVDRRFYRRSYDAAATVESFGSRLRQEVDLETVSDDLRGVVDETMQPAHVSLWLRQHEAVR